QTKRKEPRLKLLPDKDVHVINQPEEKRNHQRITSYTNLHPAIRGERFPDSRRESARQRAPECKTTHERSEHSAHCKRRRAENEPQHSRPKHFINEPGRPRHNETETDQKNR